MIESDVQALRTEPLVQFFELDTSTIPGGDIFRWHDGVNKLGNDVVWQGEVYSRLPVSATGFERSTKGTLPRPLLRVANVYGLIGELSKQLDDFSGARLTRRRTFYKYLDAVNFPGGVNSSADPNVFFPNETWFVDRKSDDDGVFLEFELATAFDVEGVMIPRRQCIQNVCPWKYRGAECGYAGGPVSTVNDVPTSDPAQDSCGKRLKSCKQRFGTYEPLSYGGFPGVGLVR